jgi:hypothetical protein
MERTMSRGGRKSTTRPAGGSLPKVGAPMTPEFVYAFTAAGCKLQPFGDESYVILLTHDPADDACFWELCGALAALPNSKVAIGRNLHALAMH